MSSTDEPRNDEESEGEPIEESVLPPGPRRSTYTPPVPRQPAAAPTDDDDLADAIAANLASATGSINVIYQLDDVAPSVPMGAPVEQLPPVPAGARILPADEAAAPPVAPPPASAAGMPSPDAAAVPADLPPPPEFAAPAPPLVDSAIDEETTTRQTPTFEVDEETTTRQQPTFAVDDSAAPEPPTFAVDDSAAPQPPTFAVDDSAAPQPPTFAVDEEPPAPVFDAPPLPSEPFDQAAFLAASAAPSGQRPWIPERQSLRDDEIASLIASGAEHPGGTLGMMEELERQMQLRDDETREFQEWQESMLAVGTPEALAAVQDVLPDFSDIVTPGAAPAAPAAAPVFDAPPPVFTAPAPVFDAPPPVFDAPAPAFDAPPPSFPAPSSTAPAPVFDAPAPAFDTPVVDAPPPVFDAPPPAFDAPVVDAPAPVFDAPPPAFDAPVADAPPPAFGTPVSDAPPPAFDAPVADAPPPVDAPVFDAPPPSAPIDEIPVFAAPAAPPPLVEPAAPPALPDAWDIEPGPVFPDSDVEPVFIEPSTPAALVEPGAFGSDPFVDRVFTGSVPVITGSIPIPAQQLDVDGDDPVDPTDQVPVSFDDFLGPNPGTAPVEPILSPRIPEDEVVLGEAQQLERSRVFSLESAGLEPTPTEQRVGRAARMFWMWFAANSSIVSIAFGAMVFSLGLSLRQAIVGVLAGVAASFLPLGLGALAGKRSGQPTMVVSRAAFGVVGNGLPAIVALISRLFWGSAMLWFLAKGTAEILIGAQVAGGLDATILTLLGLVGGFVIAIVVALFGYGLLAKFQLVVSIISGILIVGLIALTYQYVDIAAALTNPDGSWFVAGTAAVLVFSFVGLLWANSAGDLARYQRVGSSGAGAMLWTSFGTAIPTFLLISYGAILAASNEQIAEGMLTEPLDTLGRMLPVWYPAPLIAATALSLISGIVVTIYSGGFALKAAGLSLSRPASAVATAVLIAAGAFLLTQIASDMTMLFRDIATTIAVPVAAWAGIFAADTMIRNRRYHAESLLAKGGIYPTVHWVNLPAFVIITAIGFGLTTATVGGLGWQGYLFGLAGIPLDGTLAGTDLGVFAALLLGLLVPIVAGIPGIRKQESAIPAQN